MILDLTKAHLNSIVTRAGGEKDVDVTSCTRTTLYQPRHRYIVRLKIPRNLKV